MIFPGSTLGVLGGGQLGRMFCVAARTMGYRTVVLDPDPESPAGRIADEHIQADYTDLVALNQLADRCDVITTEFENVPAESLRQLLNKKPVYPSPQSVEIAQNRIKEKNFARDAGIAPAPFVAIYAETDLAQAAEVTGFPAILKSSTLGYDGKGQFVVDNLEQAQEAYRSMGSVESVLEKKLNLKKEISVLLARNAQGKVGCYSPAENEHRNGILHQSIVPARIADKVADAARQKAIDLAEAMDYVGVLAVEFFVCDGNLVANEIAPRVHNSGHWTIEGAMTSNFENHLRAILGWPLGETKVRQECVMFNIISEKPEIEVLLQMPNVHVHDYGKTPKPGRKLGHVTMCGQAEHDVRVLTNMLI